MRTPAAIRKIADPEKRAKAAADLAHEARAKAEDARQRRDLAALVMIEPFVRAVAPSNAMQADAKDAYYGYLTVGGQRFAKRDTAEKHAAETGETIEIVGPSIDTDEYEARLAAARDRRERDLAENNVEVYPADVYNLIGVSRTLFVRMMARMPDDLPRLDDPEAVAKAAVKDMRKFDALVDEAVKIRNEAVEVLLNGTGAARVKNADVARLTGLTTARVAQLRLGTR